MDTKQKIAVMQAFVDGKEVQFKSSQDTRWRALREAASNPAWDWNAMQYRIKPEPEVLYVNGYSYGVCAYKDEKVARIAAQSPVHTLYVAKKFVAVEEE